ncbi:hypothetical protein TCAL_05756 [Tigriopus californicus]|uniref:Uncharacterized protein n=1 Tax=Tigriopus californicus TaxID=6832 RepID=A0A553NFB3_TIGCA|nr:uncharacterized protein LOC131888139 [Tigriopus californicus]XP_059092906.1 uncharacterized protein LOC131888139 [Tigriopus californicus]TRY64095.1 hypothetical protein TCAL_05756 [Tigriopus californicus]|eukprot:TCALIF_05756-PA protein Name:"Protein of unknown function" AED:0.00 eAED:0.00 QI:474/1/1/1/0.75/0.6/5/152/496
MHSNARNVPDIERAKSFVVKKTSTTSHSDFPKSMFDLGRSSSFVIARQNPTMDFSSPKASPSNVDSVNSKATNVEDVIRQLQKVNSQKPKFKMKEETKLFLKLHTIHQKAIFIDGLLKELQSLTDSCREVSSDCNDNISEEFSVTEKAFVKTVLDIETEVRILKRLVLFLCRHKCLEKHLGVLNTIPDQMKSSYDISVQFFGIDWPHIFFISNNLIQLISDLVELLKEGQKSGSGSGGLDVDVVIPSNILCNLATIEAEISWHAEAVLRGRLSPSQQESISLEQNRHQALKLELDKQVEAASSGSDEIGTKMKPSVWGTLKSLHFVGWRRSRRKNQRSSDDLWKMWYHGVQSMTTFSLSTLGTPTQSDIERSEGPSARVLSRSLTKIQSIEMPDLGFSGDDSHYNPKQIGVSVTQASLGRVFSDEGINDAEESPPPSKQEQKDILGVYSNHWESVTPTLRDNRKRVNRMVQDDTLESLQLADLVDAPKQRFDESEL